MGAVGPVAFEFGTYGIDGALKWRKWLRGFEVFAKANKIEEPREKCNWLLHYAGEKVQDVFFSLPELKEKAKRTGPLASGYVKAGKDEYQVAVDRLNEFFAPKQNESYERLMFQQLKQEKDESIAMFEMRLRAQAERCEYGEQCDSIIRDQMTLNCSSTALRQRILERSTDSFDKIMKMARSFEAATMQSKAFDKGGKEQNSSEAVCKIDAKPRATYVQKSFSGECNRCGGRGHKSFEPKCPAKGKTCAKCGGQNHFARKCFSQEGKSNKKRAFPAKTEVKEEDSSVVEKKRKMDETKVRSIEESNEVHQVEEYDDVFCVFSEENPNVIGCTLGGVGINVVVDSGSKFNIVDRESWEKLKREKIEVFEIKKNSDKAFRAYGGQRLNILGTFRSEIVVGSKKEIADFFVADNKGKILLGLETAMKLGVLKIGQDVNKIEVEQAGFNAIKDVVIDIPMKEGVKPIIQPYRRVPAAVQKAVDAKINEMLNDKIIERVDGPSKWISPLVIVPKGDDIRICVDMRRANEAVERENHPLPTMDDFLTELQGARIFSRLDVKNAFHQVMIDEVILNGI